MLLVVGIADVCGPYYAAENQEKESCQFVCLLLLFFVFVVVGFVCWGWGWGGGGQIDSFQASLLFSSVQAESALDSRPTR